MKKSLVGGVGVAAALVMVFGSGTANANPYDQFAGKTYAQVQEWTNGQAKIASRVGEYLPTEECIVTGSRRMSTGGGVTLVVDLNCNDPKSAGGDGNDHAGNSVMSPAGKAVAEWKDRAVRLNSNYEKSVAAGKTPACESNFEYCVKVCQESGACSAELSEYLGL